MPGVLDPRILDTILLGAPDRRRQLQDFPILGDVWTEFALEPGGDHELLITPYKNLPAGELADHIGEQIEYRPEARLSYLHGIVAAVLTLEEVCRVIIPATSWWGNMMARCGGAPEFDRLGPLAAEQLKLAISEERRVSREAGSDEYVQDPGLARRSSTDRQLAKLAVLIGLLLMAKHHESNTKASFKFGSLQQVAEEFGRQAILETGLHMVGTMTETKTPSLIWNVSSNRKAEFAVAESVPAIKADAARQLFGISCSEISWAILDSGIDAGHRAFREPLDFTKSRVKATYDFGGIREILNKANKFNKNHRRRVAERMADEGVQDVDRNEQQLLALASQMSGNAAVDWTLVEPLVRRDPPRPPDHPHGTHVAGILGANWTDAAHPVIGVCPDISLYDFRVLGEDREESEFAVIAALQFIGWLNRRAGRRLIDGVNMSLSIRHNVRNFACGWTPVCLAANELVANGVVVVAAAGNRGFQQFRLADDSSFESYAASSITDPGNADEVITVGATHRFWPHTYGVSFFSSRGPTGDGRLKPDILAPGERIESCTPRGGLDTFDGTSMAAPHVSGAAALLMARHKELKGRPDRIKEILCSTATDLRRERSFQGHGMVDVLRAIQSV